MQKSSSNWIKHQWLIDPVLMNGIKLAVYDVLYIRMSKTGLIYNLTELDCQT